MVRLIRDITSPVATTLRTLSGSGGRRSSSTVLARNTRFVVGLVLDLVNDGVPGKKDITASLGEAYG